MEMPDIRAHSSSANARTSLGPARAGRSLRSSPVLHRAACWWPLRDSGRGWPPPPGAWNARLSDPCSLGGSAPAPQAPRAQRELMRPYLVSPGAEQPQLHVLHVGHGDGHVVVDHAGR